MNRIKELRIARGESQEQLAQHLNINRTTLTKWETRKHNPDVDTVIYIANYYNVSTDYLLGISDTPKKTSDTEKSDTEELGAALKKLFVDAGKISDDEELTESFKVYATDLVRAAIAFDKARENNE